MEILVLLVIVGVVLGALLLAAGGSAARELENAARRSQGLIALACERAVLSGRDIGFAATRDGLRFGYFEREGWRGLRDGPAEELRARPWGEGVQVRAERDGEAFDLPDEAPSQPPFACLSSGELSPLRLEFTRGDVRGGWRLDGRLDGRLELAARDDAP